MLATYQFSHGAPLRRHTPQDHKIKTTTTLWDLVCLLQDYSVDDKQMLRVLNQLSEQGRLRRP